MAKKNNVPQAVVDILKECGVDPRESVWDCHGTWVVLHKALEIVAVNRGIAFDMPVMIETNSKEKIVALCVQGHMGDRREWSIGEAAPNNNKNSYPYAMAEKRAKDRVILKLVGLHGYVYSEEEADEFQKGKPQRVGNAEAPGGAVDEWVVELKQALEIAPSPDAVKKALNGKRAEIEKLPKVQQQEIGAVARARLAELEAEAP